MLVHDDKWLKENAEKMAYGENMKDPCPIRMINFAKKYLEHILKINNIKDSTPEIPY